MASAVKKHHEIKPNGAVNRRVENLRLSRELSAQATLIS
jgi:hypothetical protein